MFTTSPIQALQRLSNPFLDFFMEFISFLGIAPIVLLISLILLYGISFKRGLVLVNIIGWTALFTFFLKEQIDFPRPTDVDPSIVSHYDPTDADLSDLKPTAFWEIFSEDLLSQTRNDAFVRFGFPSGHTSVQTAFWLSLMFLFRKRWIKAIGICMIVLTAISRMYLGNHFLGDVLAGFALGSIVSFFLILLVRKSHYLEKRTHDFKSLSILWLPVIMIPFADILPQWIAASLIGVNLAAILIVLQHNFPVFQVTLWKRISTILIGLLFFALMQFLNEIIQFISIAILDLLLPAVGFFLAVYGGIRLSRILGFIRFR